MSEVFEKFKRKNKIVFQIGLIIAGILFAFLSSVKPFSELDSTVSFNDYNSIYNAILTSISAALILTGFLTIFNDWLNKEISENEKHEDIMFCQNQLNSSKATERLLNELKLSFSKSENYGIGYPNSSKC